MRNGAVERGCTDIPCLVVFVCFSAGVFAATGLSVSGSDVLSLERGHDYRGVRCGTGDPPPDVDAARWAAMKYVWLPLAEGAAPAYALCVSVCPVYPPPDTAATPSDAAIVPYGNVDVAPSVTYDTFPRLFRCVPTEPYAFDEAALSAESLSAASFQLGTPVKLAMDLLDAAPGIVVTVTCAVVLSALWTVLLTLSGDAAAEATLRSSVCLALASMALLSGVCISFSLAADGTDVQDVSSVWQGLGITGFVLTAAFGAFACLYMAVASRRSAEVFNAARKAVYSTPAVLVIPVVTLLCLCGVTVLCVHAGIRLASHTTVATPPDGNASFVEVAVETDDGIQGLVYFIGIGWLWWVFYLQSMCYTATAVVVGDWYYARTDIASGSICTVLAALVTAVRHTGTLAFGAVMVFLRLPRLLLRLVESFLRGATGCCATTCLSVLDDVLHLYSESAFVALAVMGVEDVPSAALCGFTGAARCLHAEFLVCMPRVHPLMFDVASHLFMARLAVACLSCLIGWQLVRYSSLGGTETATYCVVVSAFAVFATTGVAFSMLHACADTLLLCYARDLSDEGPQKLPESVLALKKAGFLPTEGLDTPGRVVPTVATTAAVTATTTTMVSATGPPSDGEMRRDSHGFGVGSGPLGVRGPGGVKQLDPDMVGDNERGAFGGGGGGAGRVSGVLDDDRLVFGMVAAEGDERPQQ